MKYLCLSCGEKVRVGVGGDCTVWEPVDDKGDYAPSHFHCVAERGRANS